jgi:hypothetical protein
MCIEKSNKRREPTKGRGKAKGRPFEQNSSALRIEPTMKRGDEAAPLSHQFIRNILDLALKKIVSR